MGQTEAPLTIRQFLRPDPIKYHDLVGVAHVVMATYVKIAHVEIRRLLTAVIMTAPVQLHLCEGGTRETETPATAHNVESINRRAACRSMIGTVRATGDARGLGNWLCP